MPERRSETAQQLVRCVLDEFRRMKDEPLPEEELRRAKDHLKGATLLALEGSGQRMTSLARYHIYFDRHYTAQELIAMLEEVTAADVQQLAQRIFPVRPHRRLRGRQPQRLPAHPRPACSLIHHSELPLLTWALQFAIIFAVPARRYLQRRA